MTDDLALWVDRARQGEPFAADPPDPEAVAALIMECNTLALALRLVEGERDRLKEELERLRGERQ